MFFSGFYSVICQQISGKERWSVLAVVYHQWCNGASAHVFSRCAGQHGEVQRPGSLQLQHADSVRPWEGSVRRRAGGVVRPGPQRHQQTATASGNTHVNTSECTHWLAHFSKADLRGLKLNSILERKVFRKNNYIHNTDWLTVGGNTHTFWKALVEM